MQVKDLQPSLVWTIFDEICRIPRPSKHEERILAYLKAFALQYGLICIEDETGNLVIRKERQHSSSDKTIILQSHVDMVCEKNSDTKFDFFTDAINTYLDNGWVKARGTTLGADCGIGMAVALAILASPTISHPAIEALFTVDEETGLTGAKGLSSKLLKGGWLINLDSEDEGEFFVGCAGGIDTLAYFPLKMSPIPDHGMIASRIEIKGVIGGHSGDDINKGRANANVLMARLLFPLLEEQSIVLVSIDGGNLRNAIPREASVVIALKAEVYPTIQRWVTNFTHEIKKEYCVSEPNVNITINKITPLPSLALHQQCAKGVICSILSAVNGVVAMSQQIPDFVETSTNLASVKMTSQEVVISTSQRSSLESKKRDLSRALAITFRAHGAQVVHQNEYPGWDPAPTSSLADLFGQCYTSLFGVPAKIKAVHAGLECGLFLQKYPHWQMISVGPTIRQVHSPDEMLEIESVQRFWQLMIAVLKQL